MTVSADSRYATGTLTRVPTLFSGNVMLFPAPIDVEDTAFIYYVVSQGDRLDLLALKWYGDATKWWVIADVNPEIIWPAELMSGFVLRAPTPQATMTDVEQPAGAFQSA